MAKRNRITSTTLSRFDLRRTIVGSENDLQEKFRKTEGATTFTAHRLKATGER